VYDDSDQEATTAGTSGDDTLSVSVEGEEYELEAEYDINKDGDNDTALVQTDSGGAVAFTDVDKDGDADVAVELDDKGNVVGAARFDEASGQWVAVDPNTGQATGGSGNPTGSPTGDTHQAGTGSSRGGGEIMVDLPDQDDVSAGAATVDLNNDGTNDTAVIQADDGGVMAFTDIDGDGEADMMTVVEADGDVVVSQHSGEDEWTEVERGHIDEKGNFTPESGSRRS
jgi:hypothetical protein